MTSISLADAMPEVENDAIFKALNLSAALPPPDAGKLQQSGDMYSAYGASTEMYPQWDYSWADYDYSWYNAMAQQQWAAAEQASMLIQTASAQVSAQSAGSSTLPDVLPSSVGPDKADAELTRSTTPSMERAAGSASETDASAKDPVDEKPADVAASPSTESTTGSTLTPLVLTTPCRLGGAADELGDPELEACDVADAVTWFSNLASHTPVGSPPSLETSPGSVGFADFWPITHPVFPTTLQPQVPPLPQGPPVVLKLSEIVEKEDAAKSCRNAEAAAILQLVQGGPGVAQGAEILRKLKGGHDTPSTVASDGDGSGAGRSLLSQLKGKTEAASGEKQTRFGRRGGQGRNKGGSSACVEDEAEEFCEAPQKTPSASRDGKPRWQPRVAATGAAAPTPARRAKNGERRNLAVQ